MDEKRNWIQVLTLALCAVLLGLNLWQGRKIGDLRQQIQSVQSRAMDDARTLQKQVSALSSQIEEGEKLVRDWELTPTGMDQASNSLLTEVSLILKEWRADTEVWLTVRQGSDTNIVFLKSGGSGRFSGSVPVALAEENILLEARIDSGGTSRQEELGSWENIDMLLPVQMSASSYGGPTYQGGVFSLDYMIYLSDRDYEPVTVEEPMFFLQRNGETVWEAKGVSPQEALAEPGYSPPEDGSYSTGAPAEAECQPGDTVALFFTCRDEYGLRYTFSLESWEIDPDWMSDSRVGKASVHASYSPVLSWD